MTNGPVKTVWADTMGLEDAERDGQLHQPHQVILQWASPMGLGLVMTSAKV